jgi:hypothetical protein
MLYRLEGSIPGLLKNLKIPPLVAGAAEVLMCFNATSNIPQDGTPTKRQVSKRQVSKCLVSKRPVSKRQVYKTSGFKTSGFKTSSF